jgi:hypothetical protein
MRFFDILHDKIKVDNHEEDLILHPTYCYNSQL